MSTAVQQASTPFAPTDSQLAVAYSVCRGITRRAAKNFYYAFQVLPRQKRQALCAVYAFMRKCDDIADDVRLPLHERRQKLETWLGEFHRAQAGHPTDDPVLLALTDAQRRFNIVVGLLDQLAYGTATDVLEPQDNAGDSGLTVQYRTFEDLRKYCYGVASVVGLVCIRIFGYHQPEAEPLAERCGLAFQLTNIIRDVKEDAAMGRVYLPGEDLAKFGISASELRTASDPARFRSLLAMEADRARECYQAGLELIPMIDEDSQPALWVLVTIYRSLLDKIAAREYDVFDGKISLTVAEKLTILGKGFLQRLTRSCIQIASTPFQGRYGSSGCFIGNNGAMNDRLGRTPTAGVVGGGLAGLSASCALAESGLKVTLFERRPYLGGRASSYQHPATGEIIDNCQHVLFGSCTNLIEFYKRIGVDGKIRWSDRMTFIEPGGRRSALHTSFLPAPLHTAPSFWGVPFLDFGDKLAIARAMAVLVPFVVRDNGDTFLGWLQKHGQTEKAIARFWNPILVSALSEDLDRISVSAAAQVVRESMKSVEAGRMGIPMIPLTDLYAAAQEYITGRGGEVRLRCGVEKVRLDDAGPVLTFADGTARFDFMILAVPYFAIAALLPPEEASRSLREKIAHFESSSITGIHLWFDRKITDLPHAVLLDRTIQWMFHKSDLQERSSDGSYIELVVSASKGLIDKSRQEIIDLALREVREFFPEAGSANLLKSTVIKEFNATYSPRPGIDGYRPAHKTSWPSVFLAGDWTATGWPATMEGAVRSGYGAAEELLRGRRFLVPDLAAGGLMRLFG